MDVLINNWDLFSQGFLTTIYLFIYSAIFSLILGTIVASFRVSPVPPLRAVGWAYVNLVRNTPLTLIFLYAIFALPLIFPRIGDSFTLSVGALTVYTATYVAEAIRAGINTVPIGQAEAARSIGLTFMQSMRLVILPQAFRAVIPPLMSVFIALLKNTTVAAGFSVLEAGAIRANISERGENMLVGLLWVCLGFVILVSLLALAQRAFEKKWKIAA